MKKKKKTKLLNMENDQNIYFILDSHERLEKLFTLKQV